MELELLPLTSALLTAAPVSLAKESAGGASTEVSLVWASMAMASVSRSS